MQMSRRKGFVNFTKYYCSCVELSLVLGIQAEKTLKFKFFQCQAVAFAGRKFGGGVQGRGSGGQSPPDAGEFSKICKKFPKKVATYAVFSPILQKNISKPCVTFSLVWTKNTVGWGNFEKILKIFDENSIEKLNFYLFS